VLTELLSRVEGDVPPVMRMTLPARSGMSFSGLNAALGGILDGLQGDDYGVGFVG